ncbi:MAG: U32 family peptidase [Kiritimatiellae bacterium]|nr:U32 family peptidase [Kiritimatiellia bacterium]
MTMMKRPEILAPAGDMTCLQAALDAGADAVYLGVEDLNMRQAATTNFTRASLPEASERCRTAGVKIYLTLNTLLFEADLANVEALLQFAKPYVDAVIVADWAAIVLCQKLAVPFHVSTQMSCANTAAAKFLKQQGAARVVLARECTLEEVKSIAANSGIEIETFVHGAICVAVAGRCLLSHEAYGFSGSRGECHQPCRRKYYVREERQGDHADAEFIVTPHTVFSARDLCSITFIDQLMEAGITSFKIEGRGRNPEYVRGVVTAYRAAVDAVLGGVFTPQLAQSLEKDCAKVYHREFGHGLFHGRPGQDQLTDEELNLATTRKMHVGVVAKYYQKAAMVEITIQNNPISMGDTISIHGPTSGVVDLTVDSMRREQEHLQRAERGGWVTLPCAQRVRINDQVYRIDQVAAQAT